MAMKNKNYKFFVTAIGYDYEDKVTDVEKFFGKFDFEPAALYWYSNIVHQATSQKKELFEDCPQVHYFKFQVELCKVIKDCNECVEIVEECDIFAPEPEMDVKRIALNVGFLNSEGYEEETQLDVDDSSFEATLVDFANLLFSLRNELGIKEITYVNKEDDAYDC